MTARIIFIIIGSLGIADTLFLMMWSNGNLGTWLPLILGVPLVVIGIFLPCMAAFLKWTAACFYCVMVLFFGIMTVFLSTKANGEAEPNADVLIVLGCGVRGERVSLTLKYRLDRALSYLENSPDTLVIVSGGKGSGEKIAEALAMQRYLTSHGVDGSRIVMEDRSTSTYENFSYSNDIIRDRFGDGASIVYCTTGFHVYRSGRIAAGLGIPASGIGAKDIWYSAINNYMRESVVVTLYRILGRI